MNRRQKQAENIVRIGTVAAVGAAAVLGAAKCAYDYAFKPRRKQSQNPYQLLGKQSEEYKEEIFDAVERLEKTPCEWVYTRSIEGYQLAGRYYHQKDGAPLVIFFHGY